MPMISFYGNTTKDAVEKETSDGRKYILLQVAENIRKRDDKGEYIKDDQGHYVNSATYFHSVFINDHAICYEVQNLKSGSPIFVKGFARIDAMKDSNNYDVYKLDRVVATFINTDPFAKQESTPVEEGMATQEQVSDEEIPF